VCLSIRSYNHTRDPGPLNLVYLSYYLQQLRSYSYLRRRRPRNVWNSLAATLQNLYAFEANRRIVFAKLKSAGLDACRRGVEVNSDSWFGTRSKRVLALWAATLALAATAVAQPRPIDTEKSVMTVRAYKAGVFSALGHDHEIAAPIAGGKVDTAAHTVEIQVKASALKVHDPNVSDKDRAEIQRTMLGPEVLDAAGHPEIVFRSTNAAPGEAASWTINGNLTLHGQTRPVTVKVKEAGGHYVGTAQLKQTEFGITPVKVAGGTIRVKDEIRIEFDIQLTQ
jgi:polyisoprenoid-binding protein YceI